MASNAQKLTVLGTIGAAVITGLATIVANMDFSKREPVRANVDDTLQTVNYALQNRDRELVQSFKVLLYADDWALGNRSEEYVEQVLDEGLDDKVAYLNRMPLCAERVGDMVSEQVEAHRDRVDEVQSITQVTNLSKTEQIKMIDLTLNSYTNKVVGDLRRQLPGVPKCEK